MTVDEALAAVGAAVGRVVAAAAEMKSAEACRAEALRLLDAAKVRADNALPKARLVSTTWRGNRSVSDVVVVKRTAKRATVRRPGLVDEKSFRLGKDGRWRQTPRPEGMMETYHTLEIDE